MYGPERLFMDLTELGYAPEKVEAKGKIFAVLYGYEIEIGRFQGKVIDLGIQATPDFPQTVSSAIHIKANPQLLEKKDTIPNVRNIIDSILGAEWRYWSHNFAWNGKNKTTRRLINQIKGIFFNA